MKKDLKIAIVHDWMLAGGAERVVSELLEMFPDAPLYTSCISDDWAKKLKDRGVEVRTGYLNGSIFKKYRKFLPNLRQLWFGRLDLREFDLVISSTGAEAKGIKRLKKGAKHICYIHSPTHYYWVRYDEYMENPGFGALNWLARIGLKILVKPNRRWDYKAAQKPDLLVANSNEVKNRIKKYYDRESELVFPPVDIERFSHKPVDSKSGFIVVGRQTPYKRFDLAISACNEAGAELTVIGKGPEHENLKAIAGPTIEFKTNVTDAEMVNFMSSAEALIFPNEDDFGITPVEAQASGTAVIAYRAGGALDTIIDGVTGVFFDKQSVPELAGVVKNFNYKMYRHLEITKNARKFSSDEFQKSMSKVVDKITF